MKLKNECSEKELIKIKAAIRKYFTFNPVPTNEGEKTFYTYQQFCDFAGLAFTSGSDVAGLWICNGVDVYDLFNKKSDFRYIGFGIGEDEKCYGILWDKDENEILQQF